MPLTWYVKIRGKSATSTYARWLLMLLLVFPTPQLLAQSNTGIPVKAFFQHPQYSDVKISPDGKYLALVGAIKGDEDQTSLDLIDLAKMQMIGHYALLGQQQVAEIWWVTNTKIIFTTTIQTGSFDEPLYTGLVWMMGVDDNDPEIINNAGEVITVLHSDDGKKGHIVMGTWASFSHAVLGTHIYFHGKRDDNISITYIKPAKDGGWVTVDHQGQSRLTSRYNEMTIVPELYYREPGAESYDWKNISSLISHEPRYTGYGPVAFAADDKEFYYTGITPAGTMGLYLVDPHGPTKSLLYSDPQYDIQTDFDSYSNWLTSYDGKSLLAFEYMADHPVWILIKQTSPEAQLLNKLENSFDGQNVEIVSAAWDGSQVILFVSSDRNPGQYYLYDAKTDKAQMLFTVLPGIEPNAMAPMQPVQFKARDGLTIHGYLTTPLGQSKHLPLIVLPHGGPFGVRDNWGFDPEVQFFAYHGYAVLQVEYRGSGGYGYAFQKAGYHQWGGSMQDDLTDGTHWAIQQGIADPNRICIYGASYGGYAALEGVVKEPELYKCAVGYAGVYDLPQMRSRAHTLHYQFEIPAMTTELGDDEDYLKAHSPVFQVDKIKAALFLAHGGADKTVPDDQVDELRDALDKIHKPYAWVYFRNEGHGFYTLDHKVELYTKMLAFFDTNIGPQSTAH